MSRFTGATAPDPAASESPYDWWMLTLVVVLLGVGLVMVLSASGIVAEKIYNDKYFFFKKQALFAALGGLALWCAALLPRSWLYRLQYPALFGVLILVLITLTPLAPKINGAKRWISLGSFSIQPMEFVKIAVALYLAYFMSSKQNLVKTFSKGVIPPFAVTGLFCILLLLQPDFGSAVVLAGILFFMCLAGGTRFVYLFVSLGMAVGGALALVLTTGYRARRLMAFLDPFQDANNTGYQLVQSLYALGLGGFSGVGVGASRQKMFYLPEAHNDFIIAVLGEEMGFIGITLVMLLFALLFWRCYRVIMGQRTLRDRLSAFGITLVLSLGAVLNLAVVMGMAPPKGVPMPFLSYGGSSLLATMICVGRMLNFSRTMGRWDPPASPGR
jgi:cell division protein FtsW